MTQKVIDGLRLHFLEISAMGRGVDEARNHPLSSSFNLNSSPMSYSSQAPPLMQEP